MVLGVTTDDGFFTYKDSKISVEDALASYEVKLEPIFATKANEGTMPVKVELYNTDKKLKAAPSVLKGAKPRVLIPVFPGTNCEIDSARAFERAGGEADVFVVRNKNQNDINESFEVLTNKIKEANIIMLPIMPERIKNQ